MAVYNGVTMLSERDKSQLDNLRQMGLNLEIAQPIRFFCYFPVEPSAKGTAMRLREQGYKTDLTDAGEGIAMRWTLFATKIMVPSEINISRANEFVSRTVKSLSGQFDGWSVGH